MKQADKSNSSRKLSLQKSVPFCKSPTKKYTDVLYYISTTKSSKEAQFFDKFDKKK